LFAFQNIDSFRLAVREKGLRLTAFTLAGFPGSTPVKIDLGEMLYKFCR
jgi:hypothetical protein